MDGGYAASYDRPSLLNTDVGQTASGVSPSMIISRTSPLLNLPSGLDRKQRYFLEGIRLSIQLVDTSYRRLSSSIRDLPENARPEFGTVPQLLLDAWGQVDATFRLRGLIEQMPRYRKKAPSKQVYLRATANVEALRNSLQHLNTDIDTLLSLDVPIMGALTWLRPCARGTGTFLLESAIPGALAGSSPRSLVQLPSEAPTEVSCVTLWAAGTSADLTAIHAATARLATALEGSLAKRFASHPTDMADLLVGMELSVQDAETP